MDARRADFEQRLEEEAGRPALIRQRLTEAKLQQEEVATQLKLPPPADEGPATSEARRWALETDFDALSTEIKMLDQELLSQPARVDLLQAKRDKAAASVEWVGARVKMLDELVNRKRQEEAEQARAEAEATRREAQGKHPLVLGLAERNAALSEELAQAAARLNALAEQTEQTDKLARRIETQFKSARDTVAIGGLSQELGRILQQQRRSLPDLRDYRRAARERKDKAVEIGVRRLRHLEEENRLRDLDAYLAELMAGTDTGAAVEQTPLVQGQLRELAVDRQGLLEKAVAADDLYLRRLGELESAQQRLLDAVEDYDAFLDEHLLWVRNTSLFQLDQLGAMSVPNGASPFTRRVAPGGADDRLSGDALPRLRPARRGARPVAVGPQAPDRGDSGPERQARQADHRPLRLHASGPRADRDRGRALAAGGGGDRLAAQGVGRGDGLHNRGGCVRCSPSRFSSTGCACSA